MDSVDIQKIFGASLKEIRKMKDLTQEELGALIGVEAGTIYRLEAGKNFPKSDTFAKLCDVLNIHPSILFATNPTLILKEHADSIKIISRLLQSFPQDKLNDAYNILRIMNK